MMQYGDKRKAVLDALQNKPMSVHDLHERFRPDITYAYLRTLLYKLHHTGVVEVCGTGQLTISQNGGHREYFIYKLAGADALPVAEEQKTRRVFRVGYKYPKKVGMKPRGTRGRPHKQLLTDKQMTVDERRSLMLETIPLFQMYFNPTT
jgi:hypothetical protein